MVLLLYISGGKFGARHIDLCETLASAAMMCHVSVLSLLEHETFCFLVRSYPRRFVAAESVRWAAIPSAWVSRNHHSAKKL